MADEDVYHVRDTTMSPYGKRAKTPYRTAKGVMSRGKDGASDRLRPDPTVVHTNQVLGGLGAEGMFGDRPEEPIPMNLFNRSNQNGAPRDKATVVNISPATF